VISYDPQKSNILFNEDIEQNILKKEFEIYALEPEPVFIARLVTHTQLQEELPKMNVELYITGAANALPEYSKLKPVLLITKGFVDILPDSDGKEDKLCFMNILKNRSLFEEVIEIDEHIDEKGHVTRSLSESEINEVLRRVYKVRTKSVVMALMNNSENPIHEKILKNLLTATGYRFLFVSHEAEQSIRLLLRSPVHLVNDFISLVITSYLKNVQSKLGKGSTLKIMASNGELFEAEHFYSRDKI
jgi:5-oxoprolinase (ATP-hydrolysing)